MAGFLLLSLCLLFLLFRSFLIAFLAAVFLAIFLVFVLACRGAAFYRAGRIL